VKYEPFKEGNMDLKTFWIRRYEKRQVGVTIGNLLGQKTRFFRNRGENG
jgi:hypothetical protein